jgi:hypothetical protein
METEFIPPEIPTEQILLGVIIVVLLIVLLVALAILYNQRKGQRIKNNRPRGQENTPVMAALGVTSTTSPKPATSVTTGTSNMLDSVGTVRKRPNLKNQLGLLLAIHNIVLESNGQRMDPRLFEHNRWTTLAYNLLYQICKNKNETPNVSNAINTMDSLNLLDVNELAELSNPKNENATVMTYILKQNGFSEDDTKRAIDLFAHMGAGIKNNYNGNLQNGLRSTGDLMRKSYVNTFRCEALTDEQLSYGISYWLQDIFNFPMSSEDQYIREFCNKNGVSLQDLLKAVDEQGLNISIVEDLFKNYHDSFEKILLEMDNIPPDKIPPTTGDEEKDWYARAEIAINNLLSSQKA